MDMLRETVINRTCVSIGCYGTDIVCDICGSSSSNACGSGACGGGACGGGACGGAGCCNEGSCEFHFRIDTG